MQPNAPPIPYNIPALSNKTLEILHFILNLIENEGEMVVFRLIV